MNKTASSETIRKTTFNLYPYKGNPDKHKKKTNQDLLEWLVGFTEGRESNKRNREDTKKLKIESI